MSTTLRQTFTILCCRKVLNEELQRRANDNFLSADASRSAVASSSSDLSHTAAMAKASRQLASFGESMTPAGGRMVPQCGKENLSTCKSDRLPVCGDSFFDESLTSSLEGTPVPTGLQSTSRKDMQPPWIDEPRTNINRPDSACAQKTRSADSYLTPVSSVRRPFEFKSAGAAMSSAVKPVLRPLTNTRDKQQAGSAYCDAAAIGETIMPDWSSSRNVNQLMRGNQNENDCVIALPTGSSHDRLPQASAPG